MKHFLNHRTTHDQSVSRVTANQQQRIIDEFKYLYTVCPDLLYTPFTLL